MYRLNGRFVPVAVIQRVVANSRFAAEAAVRPGPWIAESRQSFTLMGVTLPQDILLELY